MTQQLNVYATCCFISIGTYIKSYASCLLHPLSQIHNFSYSLQFMSYPYVVEVERRESNHNKIT